MNLTKISKINIIIYKITKLKTKIENFWELPQIGIWELGGALRRTGGAAQAAAAGRWAAAPVVASLRLGRE